MTDTDPKTEAIYLQMLMARSHEERFLMGIEMCHAARLTVLASLPKGLSKVERQIAILRRYYGTDLGEDELRKIENALRQRDSAGRRSADHAAEEQRHAPAKS